MLGLFLTFIIFIFTVVLHIILHRILVLFGKVTFKTVLIFPIIFLVNLYIQLFVIKNNSYPWTSIILFSFFTLDYLTQIASPYLGDEGPSSRILLFVLNKKLVAKAEILKIFSDKEMIIKRLDDMVKAGWIEKRNNSYKMLKKGRLLSEGMILYRKVFGWRVVG
ncbi:MAG: hypothetical protein R3321_10545 [Nitrososphaeraceae archaeon]|nr:hypothetical protein [Nitrososphaeraceae archaeon]